MDTLHDEHCEPGCTIKHIPPGRAELAARAAKERGEDELAAVVAVTPPDVLAEAFRIIGTWHSS